MNPHFAAPSRQAVAAFAERRGDAYDSAQRRAVASASSQNASASQADTRPHALQRHRSEGSARSSSSWRQHLHQNLPQPPPPSRPQHARSKSIPIRPMSSSGADGEGGGMRRTPSEQRLHEDEAMADYRDLVMFRRIAEGIRRRQRNTTHFHPRMVNDLCLASIIDTRNLTGDELLELRMSEGVDRAAHNYDDVYDYDYDRVSSKCGSPRRRNGPPQQLVGHQPAKTTSYLDPITCKWIIAPGLYHHRHHHRLSSSSSAAAAAAAAISDALSSHSASAEDEMPFPLEL